MRGKMNHERDEMRERRSARLSPAGRELLAEIADLVINPATHRRIWIGRKSGP
jgi:DNA-binding PadR family transcriptional regulator